MRSAAERGALILAALGTLCGPGSATVMASNGSPHDPTHEIHEPTAPAPAQPITDSEISDAVARLKEDAALGQTHKVRRLAWRAQGGEKPKPAPLWLDQLGRLFDAVAEGGRTLLLVLAVVLAGLLGVYIMRLLRNGRVLRDLRGGFAAPTHVQDLDIRPESLPADIGAAAWRLWNQNQHRPALSLLYRGLLSRLAHGHAVPILHSSTEGDCLRLAAKHLTARTAQYVTRLICIWQRAVYGGLEPTTDDVSTLCADFAPSLDAPPSTSALAAEAVA